MESFSKFECLNPIICTKQTFVMLLFEFRWHGEVQSGLYIFFKNQLFYFIYIAVFSFTNIGSFVDVE